MIAGEYRVRPSSTRSRLALILLAWAALTLPSTAGIRASGGGPPPRQETARGAPAAARSGAEVYRAACITCHGPAGHSNPVSHVGFDVPIPEFSDCQGATPELESGWAAVIHDGGPARAFDRHMPAFGSALSEQEIRNVVRYLRSLCEDTRWPLGEMNLPRPLVTEKAFPENELVLTTTVSRTDGSSVGNRFVYEHRVGPRSMYEVGVPIDLQRPQEGGWTRGLGDVTAGVKHVLFHDRDTIVSIGGETAFPTGKESAGLGKDVQLFESYLAYGQRLPSASFLHAQAGAEVSADRSKSAPEVFWRAAAGRTLVPTRFGREWSPMIELLAVRELSSGAAVEWDIVPQAQVTLSTRQHVRLNAGFQLPVNEREGRSRAFQVYLLWDWFDGGFFSGW